MEHYWLHGRINSGVSMAGPDQIWQTGIYPSESDGSSSTFGETLRAKK